MFIFTLTLNVTKYWTYNQLRNQNTDDNCNDDDGTKTRQDNLYDIKRLIIILWEKLELSLIIIIITIIIYYRKWRRRMFLDANASTSLQTILVANAHLAEGQFLLEDQTLNNPKSLICRAGTRRLAISKTEGQDLKPK
jgi:hypothetical protein